LMMMMMIKDISTDMDVGTVLILQYCAISLSPVYWAVFVRHPNSSNSSNSSLPEEQRLYLWQPQKIGKHQIVVRPFSLNPGDYRFEAKVRIQTEYIDGEL